MTSGPSAPSSPSSPSTPAAPSAQAAVAAGAAPALVLLPGMACDGELFRHVLPALQAQYTAPVVVADAHLHEASIGAMVQRLLADAPAGPLLLAGCSLGGMLALHAWAAAPQRVRGLAILGSTARPDPPEMVALRTQACEMFEQGRMEEVLRVNAMFAFDPANGQRLVNDYVAMVQRGGVAALVRQNRAVMARPDLRPMLPTVSCPTLVVGGLGDQLTPPDCSREIAAAIPGAQLELLATCGHMLTWEQPEAVTALLQQWLWRCNPG